ncbi:MAG: T9SS type A sorting domain-containing protein [Ignavibacteriaceae bacterium]|nr:T9SS type A sorting domain-containing protein [Ignavibacteriaceae bacterium]
MFKKFFLVLSLFVAMAFNSQAQTWQFASVFPADSTQGAGTHGIAVDPDGKIWIQCYYAYTRDSLQVPGYDAATGALKTVKASVRALYVFNPDGTQASFSPILFNKVGGVVKDTLGGETAFKSIKNPLDTTVMITVPAWSAMTGRGLTLDENGNVVAAYFDQLYKFDYKTGEGLMNRLVLGIGGTVKPGVDAAGNYYVRSVIPGGPIKMFDKAGVFLGNALDITTGYCRSIDVSKNGLTVYHPAYSVHYVQTLKRADEFSTFVSDTVLRGFDCESLVWDPVKPDQLWLSSGSYNDLPNRHTGEVTNYDVATWYAYDTKTNTISGEKMAWTFYTAANAAERPRAIGFSPDGATAYLGTFSAGAVRKYTRSGVGVEQLGNTIPTVYMLDQNYPNPFNPETSIRFSIPQESFVTVKVFNTLGEEVMTLVNEQKTAGVYNASFKANSLTSGIYFYTIKANDFTSTKKMILMK